MRQANGWTGASLHAARCSRIFKNSQADKRIVLQHRLYNTALPFLYPQPQIHQTRRSCLPRLIRLPLRYYRTYVASRYWRKGCTTPCGTRAGSSDTSDLCRGAATTLTPRLLQRRGGLPGGPQLPTAAVDATTWREASREETATAR